MQTTRTITVEREEVAGVWCNQCEDPITSDAFDYGNYISVSYTGGYASKMGDMSSYSFDLCESCLKTIISGFKIKAKMEDHW